MSDYRYYLPAPQTSTMAMVSLITGIASWVVLPLIGAVIAVVTGHLGRKEIRESGGRLTGDGLATAGLVLGYLQIGLSVAGVCLGLCLFTVLLSAAGASTQY